MDTCATITEVDRLSSEGGLKKARNDLRRFAFVEMKKDGYKKTVAASAQKWTDLLKVKLPKDLSELIKDPYEWLRLAGGIELGDEQHGIELFLYPLSDTKAAVSIGFDSTVYDALYILDAAGESIININVKQDLLALLLLLTTSFSAGALSFMALASADGLVRQLSVADILDWLVKPTHDAIRRLPFLVAGTRAELVKREQVEKKWPAERLVESTTGFLLFDGLY
jgi:hypothetical protein